MDKILEAITIWKSDTTMEYLDYLKNPNILTPVTLMAVELHGIAGDVNDIRENMKGIVNVETIASAEPKKDEVIDLISLAKDGMGWVAAIVGFTSNWDKFKSIFNGLRPAVVGLLASAALVLMNAENFGSPTEDTYSFVISIIIFLIAFIGTRKYKANPILMIIACGIAGLLLY